MVWRRGNPLLTLALLPFVATHPSPLSNLTLEAFSIIFFILVIPDLNQSLSLVISSFEKKTLTLVILK